MRADKIFSMTYSSDGYGEWCEIYCLVLASSSKQALNFIESDIWNLEEERERYKFKELKECENSLNISADKPFFLKKQNTECGCSLG